MKQERSFPKLIITAKEEARIRFGHPWIYADEIIEGEENLENGCLVDICNRKGSYLGTGLYSAHSMIRVRLLDRNANETFQEAFFDRRVQYALAYRHDVMDHFEALRLIHGEADGLPGVTIDLYGDIAVSEILSYGMELRKAWIYHALVKHLHTYGITLRGIYERNEGALRIKEGLEQYKGWYEDEILTKQETLLEIKENNIYFEVDVENGQKTGFFLDQKNNRNVIQKLAKGKTVLDCCTHTGSFALNAAYGNASSIRAIDVSEQAIQLAKQNALRNHLDNRIDFVVKDVFEYLEEAIKLKEKYDLVILDPPAFTKSRKTKASALKGYERLNILGMRVTKRGGYLATCSCSHFVDASTFKQMLLDAAKEAGVSLKMIVELGAAPDHPTLLSVPETSYLKFFLFQVI